MHSDAIEEIHRFALKALLIVFANLICITITLSQYAVNDFVHYTVRDGLSDHSITCINQDSYGFLWIGTEFGLNRFDGTRFERFIQDDPAGFLTSSVITNIVSLDDHRFAVVTRYGLQVVNATDFTIQQYLIPDTTAFAARLNDFQDVIEFGNGQIGVSSTTGFYVFHPDGTIAFRHDAYQPEDIGNERVFYARQIVPGPDHTCLIYVHDFSQAVYDQKKQSFDLIDHHDPVWKHLTQPQPSGWHGIAQLNEDEFMFLSRTDSLVSVNRKSSIRQAWKMPAFFKNELSWESSVFMENDTTFFINGAYKGFYRFHLNRITGSIAFDSTRYLDQFKIRCFYNDAEKRLWIGTTEGLLKEKSRPLFTKQYHWPVRDITRTGYTNVLRYGDKLYLTRFSSDTGLVVVNANSMQVEKKISFFGSEDTWDEIVNGNELYPDTFWFATYNGLMWFAPRDETYGKVDDLLNLQNDVEWTVLTPAQKDGSAWMLRLMDGQVGRLELATKQLTIFEKHSSPPLPFQKVKSLCTDAYGDTWIGGHSLTRWSRSKNTFDTLITVYGGPNKYEDDIKLLRADGHGSLWMHNVGNCLLQYKIKEREWVHYGVNNGFPSGTILAMSPVLDNILWMMFPNHLARFDIRTKSFELFDQSDGLPGIKPAANSIPVDTTTGSMYLLYHDHVVVVPFDFRRDTMTGEELLFREISVNGTQSHYFPKSKLMLSARENNLAVHFTIVNFDDNHHARFAYRINDTIWNSLGEQQTLHLTNLAPGDYQLEVVATLKSGERIPNLLSFRIAPPFWMTTWFIALCGALAIMLAYALYRWRIAHVQQRANLDKLLSQTEMKALHAQMNPHFIFNSLNSIREMILNNETREASRFLANFAHLIRITLDQSRQSFISLRHTIDYLQRYIEMEKIRNPDFHFTMTVDESLDPDEIILPPLLIQPFIENAIWHGMDGDERDLHIHVQFRKDGEQLVCTIEDDGVGIEHALKSKQRNNGGHESVSIANIQRRIELLNRKHDLQSSIAIRDKNSGTSADTGTIVRITLPLEINER